MRRPSLLGQILGLNVLLVTASIFLASMAAGLDLTIADQRNQFLVLALAILLTLVVNIWLLRRRFEPLERLLDTMERIDLSRPGRRVELDAQLARDSTDVQRLVGAFNHMLERLEAERRRSGELVLKAQEEERRRVARDLHDEVNQALTALLLRLEASAQQAPPELRQELAETKLLANQAMSELLDLARQLRPTALDDHGLASALAGHVREYDLRGPARARFELDGGLEELPQDVELVIYRVAQEALTNAARHSGAEHIEVSLGRVDSTVVLEVSDDGTGFAFADEAKGLGLSGMRERALLVDGSLEIDSRPGRGTKVRLEVPITARAGEPAPAAAGDGRR
jgi:two-component system, NarL family, sensor histidine kinase UhpB